MFFVLPTAAIFAIYILAAVLPAIFLLRYIYKHDTVDKEPPGLLLSLILMGIVAALMSIVLEIIGEKILNDQISQDDKYYKIILAFAVVAVVEEGTKFLLMKLKTWKNPNFNYSFDGIVYAVSVSLGFAAFENIICYELRSVRCAPARGARRSRSYGIRGVYGSVLRARQALLRPRLQGQKGDESPRLLSLCNVPARVL